MKLLIREIKYTRRFDGSKVKSETTTEELFSLVVGPLSFSRRPSMFEIVEVRDNEIDLKIHTRMKLGYLIKTIRKNELENFVPLPTKDGLVSFVYEFELVEVNYETY